MVVSATFRPDRDPQSAPSAGKFIDRGAAIASKTMRLRVIFFLDTDVVRACMDEIIRHRVFDGL
jgi:hypothetical protein